MTKRPAAEFVLAVLAVAMGLAIGWVSARPSWDDTGVTAGSLVASAAIVAAISGRRPWLWAVLVGAGTPLFEIASGGSAASLAAFAFAGLGAVVGWAAARTVREARQEPS